MKSVRETDLYDLKERIEEAKKRATELKGQQTLLFQQLKEQYKVQSVEEAKGLIDNLNEEIQNLQDSINEGIQKLQQSGLL